MLLLAVTTVGLILLFFLRPGARDGDVLERINSTGIVRIGYANEAPYGYLDSDTSRITGEAPEIARVILTRMGATKIEPVVTEFGSLNSWSESGPLRSNRGGHVHHPSARQGNQFSNPTYAVGEAFLVAIGNPLDLHSFEDVARTRQHGSVLWAVAWNMVTLRPLLFLRSVLSSFPTIPVPWKDSKPAGSTQWRQQF